MKGDRNSLLEELAKRCEAATGPGRALNVAIFAARFGQFRQGPHFTASISCATRIP